MRVTIQIIVALLFMAGCGQKGPLFLPGDPSAIQTDVPAPNRAEEPEDNTDEDENEEDQ